MKVSEIFNSLQGEIDVGKPAIFIRLSGCNLIQKGKGCKWCDSLYAEKEYKEMSVDEIMNSIKNFDCKNVVITGGEPLHSKDIFTLIIALHDNDYKIDIETNGTIWDERIFTLVDKVNCSPKRQYLVLDTLKKLRKLKNVRFKFVFEEGFTLWWEDIISKLDIIPERVYIMPEGKTREEQLKRMEKVWEYCVKKGYNFTPRMHILIYNNKRGV